MSSSRTRGGGAPPVRSIRARRAVGTGGSTGPRSHNGTATESSIDPTSSTAAARLPRRPKEYRASATVNNTQAKIVVAVAPSRMRSAAPSLSTAWKALRFAQVTIAADAAIAAPSHASNRTLNHAGDSGRDASASRIRIRK